MIKIMRAVSIVVLGASMGAGCANELGGPEAARQVVSNHVGDGVGTVGPFTRTDKKELASLSPPDRSAATALLDAGALGFLICSREDGAAPPAGGAALADMIKVDRIILVRGGKIVGDFPAAK